jgi:hypothetical protein
MPVYCSNQSQEYELSTPVSFAERMNRI